MYCIFRNYKQFGLISGLGLARLVPSSIVGSHTCTFSNAPCLPMIHFETQDFIDLQEKMGHVEFSFEFFIYSEKYLLLFMFHLLLVSIEYVPIIVII